MGSLETQHDLRQEVVLLLLPFDVPQSYLQKLRQKYPGIVLRWHNMRTDEKILTYEDIPKDLFRDVTILATKRLPPPDFVPNCHFVQLTSAGPDKSVELPLYKNPKVAICTANGVHPPQIAEWVLGAWLSHQHHFMKYAAFQRENYWPSDFDRSNAVVEDSPGLRMGILGYGAIGRQCARLAQAMGMDVVAYTSRARLTPESRKDDSYCVPGTGDPDGLIPSAWYHGFSEDALHSFLAHDLDVLVVCLPLTRQSVGIIGAAQFDILSRKRTFVMNVGRGPHIDTPALIAALEAGKIRGAALDVTDPEPLPQNHPLWTAPNVFITPHVSWQTPHYFTRVLDIIERNLERLSKGEALINRVDKMLHY